MSETARIKWVFSLYICLRFKKPVYYLCRRAVLKHLKNIVLIYHSVGVVEVAVITVVLLLLVIVAFSFRFPPTLELHLLKCFTLLRFAIKFWTVLVLQGSFYS